MQKVTSLAVLVLALSVGVAFAQETTSGSITGKVVDAQGLVLPGVTVTITSSQGTKTFVTDSTGRFFAPYLTPGTYTVKLRAAGLLDRRPRQRGGATRPASRPARDDAGRQGVGERHGDGRRAGRQHLVDDGRDQSGHRGARPDSRGAHLHQRALCGAGRQHERRRRPGEPVDLGRQRPRERVRRGRHQHDQRGLRRGRVLLDRVRLARHRRAVRLPEGDPGQDRRLRRRVRRGDGRRGQRRHQERVEPVPRVALRLHAAVGARGHVHAHHDHQRDAARGGEHGQHHGRRRRHRARRPDRPQQAVLLRRGGPAVPAHDARGARGLPAGVDGQREPQPPGHAVRGQGHLAADPDAAHRRVVLRRPVARRHGAAAPHVAPAHHDLGLQLARLRRQQPDGEVPGRADAQLAGRGVGVARGQQHHRDALGQQPGR